MDTRDAFSIEIGITTNEAQNQKVLNKMLQTISQELNKEFNINLDPQDVEGIINKLQEIGSTINSVIDDAGNLRQLNVQFESASGSVVKLNTSLGEVVYTMQQLRDLGENLNSGWVREIVALGNAFDSSGNPVGYANRGSATSFVDTEGIKVVTQHMTEMASVLKNVESQYKEILQLTKQMNSQKVNSNEWNLLASKIIAANINLQQYIDNNRELVSQDKLQVITQKYEKQIDTVNKLAQAKRNTQAQEQAQKQQETEIIAKMNQRYSVLTELSKLDSKRNANAVSYNQARLYELDRELSQYEEVIQSNQKLLAVRTELANKEQSLNNRVTDSEDEQKIKEAVRLTEDLYKAETELYKIRQQRGSNVAIQEAEEEVRRLAIAVNDATSAELSNQRAVQEGGATVRESTTYREAATKAEQEALSTQRLLDDSYKSSGVSLANMANKLKEVAKNTLEYKLLWGVWGLLGDAIRSSVDKIKELDTAMVSIQLVTGQTNEQVRQLMLSYSDLAIELGVTTKQIADGSAEWFRQGKTIEEVNELLKASTILSVTGNMEASQSTELLTAALNGFRMEATEAMSLVDRFVEADLNFATSAEEIAVALQYVASSAQAAEINLDKIVGLITAVSSTTRMSAESIGNSLKTIISRMQNIKIGKFVDEEFGESLNDVEKTLGALGIAIRTSEQDWRSMEDVLDEVGSRWKEFTEIEQSAIATALGG
jgi:TP901 family phage tail tape measure protein